MHALQPRVDAVLSLAGDDIPPVGQVRLALADIAELARVLEAQGFAESGDAQQFRRTGLYRTGPRRAAAVRAEAVQAGRAGGG